VDARPAGPGEVLAIDVTDVAGVPSSGVSGLVLNRTATNPTTLTYLTVSPGGQSIPLASNLSAYPGRTTATAVTAAVRASGVVNFTNALGSVDVIADVAPQGGSPSTRTRDAV
jgi:hypothetical protein